MTSGHNVFKEIEYIQQALSQNRKPIGFMLSAGCPLSIRVNHRVEKNEAGESWDASDPLVQDIAGLTRKIGNDLKSSKDNEPTDWDTLIALCVEDGIADPNIETILSFIRGLKSIVGKGSARGFNAKALHSLEKEICKIILKEVDQVLPDNHSPYHNLAIWVRSIARESPVHLFTTNYDLLAEQALEEEAAPYFDGFIGSRKAFFDLAAVEDEKVLPPRWTRLWKMHGSINWRLESKGAVSRGATTSENDNYLIYPSHLKYDESRKMPFLAMMDRFKAFIQQQSSVIFISGYSFGDEHINSILLEGLRSNPTAMAYGLLHGSLLKPDGKPDPKYENARTLALRTPNLSLLAGDCGVVGRSEQKWDFSQESRGNLPIGLVEINEGADGDRSSSVCHIGDFKMFSELLRTISGPRESNE